MDAPLGALRRAARAVNEAKNIGELLGVEGLQLTRMEYDHDSRQYYSVDRYPLRDGLRAAIGERG